MTMNFDVGTKLCGFTVEKVRAVKELDATLYEMVHDKTCAELCFMDNKADNKLFSVAFKTLPEDSTGVFHILEHSVLNGSEKYPVKEPFVDLLKSSMNTFLNAMTFPDKTMYPVSSRNDKDFLNLTSVYLDAVFAPRLRVNPNIFYQEGIHTEIEGETPSYKGVVFNEMKGSMSSVDNRIDHGINELLFPENCYRFNSGGDPKVIPDLTYKQFADTYRRYYHPSNSRFYLDGDVPLEETLSMIDSYLDRYEKEDEKFEIPMQTPRAAEGIWYYEISESENRGKKDILALGKIVGTWEEKSKLLASQILCDVVAGTNEAPLKRAVLSSGLAEDFEMAVMDGIAQPYLIMIARNMSDADTDKIKKVIKETAEKLISEGIDKELITASVNRFAFSSKQIPEPQGIYRAIGTLNSWLYGGDPLMYLLYDDVIAEMREMAKGDGFEKLLSELLIDDETLCTLHMLPSVTLGDDDRKTEEERVKKEVAALSEKEMGELATLNEKLVEWQKTPDPEEMADCVPTLTLNEVSETPEYIETVESEKDGVTLLYHPIPTHGIVYLSMYFPLTKYSLEELTKISLLTELYGELATEKRSATELQKEVKTYIGSLNFKMKVFSKDDDTHSCTPCLVANAGVLEENLEAAIPLITEILTETKFDDTAKIKEIIMQADEMARQSASANGHSLGILAVRSHYTSSAAVDEAIGGYTLVKFLHDFAKDFDGKVAGVIALLEKVKGEVIGKAGLTVSVTSSEEVSVDALIDSLPEGTVSPETASYKTELPEKMGIKIPSQITYAVKGYNLSCLGMKMTGSLRVAANIISFSYLWNKVRVQGGAYGTGFPVSRDGSILSYSYRDPSPAKTLETYDKTADFVREFCDSGEALDKYIISAIASTEPLRTPAAMGQVADDFKFSGVTDADRLATRREMLSTDREALKGWCEALEKTSENGAVCVVGHVAALEECGDLEVLEI